jgi:putative ABC transport system permease protein
MSFVALKMLLGDPVKYLGLIFGVAFATLLIIQQTSIFVGLLSRAGAEVRDVREATLWIMDPAVKTIVDARPMRDTMLARVRGVPGVAWASPLVRGGGAIRTANGQQLGTTITGVDDATLIGAPLKMVLGDRANLRDPDAILVDADGFGRLFPGVTPRLNDEVELNDHRAVIRGIVKTSPSFAGGVSLFARYSTALGFINSGRTQLSFILAREAAGALPADIAKAVTLATGLKAVSREDFIKASRDDVIQNTGIPISIGTTDVLGVIVGVAIVGLTFTIFIAENLRQFGALKAIGVSNSQLVGMVLLQAALVGVIGYAIGLGVAGWFFLAAAANIPTFDGFFLPWEVGVLTAGVVVVIIVSAALLAMRRVLIIDPAIVFRG